MNSLNQTDFFPVSVINKNSSVVGKRPLSHIKWKVILCSIKTDNQSIISIKAINQLSEREIDECLLDWSTSLMACNHSKNYACVCVCVCPWVRCVRVHLCGCLCMAVSIVCLLSLTQVSNIDFTDMSQHALAQHTSKHTAFVCVYMEETMARLMFPGVKRTFRPQLHS